MRADGTPSGSLRRRVEGALAQARDVPERIFVASGGLGPHGPPEAHVVRDILLAAGIPRREILVEDRAADTLESVLFCHELLHGRSDIALLVPCSSGFHLPRCSVLFRLLGYRVCTGPMPADRPHLGTARWTGYVVKESLALPYDAGLMLVRLAGRRVRRR